MRKKSLRGRVDGAPNPIDIHVGNRVRMRRTLLGMSQEKLGDELGLTFQQVQKYERGMNRIGASRLWDISKVLNTPIEFFYDGMNEDIEQLSPRHINRSTHVEGLEETIISLDGDPMNRRETLELVRAYYRITDRNIAKKVFDLVKSMAAFTDPNGETAEKTEKNETTGTTEGAEKKEEK